MATGPASEPKRGLLSASGPFGAFVASFDWAATPLGPIDQWPRHLWTSTLLILSCPHPMWIGWGAEMTCLYNEACIRLLGKAKHPWAMGRPAAAVWADVWARTSGCADRALRLGEPARADDVHLFLDHGDAVEEALCSFSFGPIRDEQGVGGFFCPIAETPAALVDGLAGADRRRYRRAGADRRDAEGQERKEGIDEVLRHATVGFAQLDLSGRFVVVNARYCAMVGRSRDELRRLRIQDITHPDDLPSAAALFRRATESGEDFVIEKRYVHPDGSVVWVNSNVYALTDAAGRPDHIVAVSIDVTDQKQAQEALRRSEQRYRRIFETVGVSLWEEDLTDVKAVIDTLRQAGVSDFRQYFADHPDFVDRCIGLVRIVDVNPASLRMFGASDKDQLLRSLNDVFEPQTREVFVGALLALAEGRQKFEGEAFHRTLQGERLSVLVGITFPVGDDSLGSVLVSLTNITARKQAEDALQEAYVSLEHSSRVKDEFLATLSHELRTPLNAVLGWSRMLRAGTMRPDIEARALESIERNAKAQSQLVEDLLDVSRIISGKLQIKADAVDLAQVIAGAVDAIRPGANAKGLLLEVDVEPDTLVQVTGDADRLQQVVWNLLSNAMKFTPGGGRVRIALSVDAACARIVVADTGQGISPSFLPHVFERFRQEDGTLSRKHTGLGLGLSIVRHLTEAHGGTITAASPGEHLGATFEIRLPIRAIRRYEPEGPGSLDQGSQRALAGVRVLVVDDDPDARDLIRTVLDACGARVALAGSAGEALHLIDRQPFDVLIADIGMPERDGYSLIRAVRALPTERGALMPAIAVTAYAGSSDREQALAAGFSRHLAKPVEPEVLTATVAFVVGSPA